MARKFLYQLAEKEQPATPKRPRRAARSQGTSKPKTRRKDIAILKLEGQIAERGIMPIQAREVRFHPARQWRIDFAWPHLKIGVEFEGGIFAIGKACLICGQKPMGGHTRGRHYESDCMKYAEAALHGWIIIRTTENLIKNGTTIDLIERAFAMRKFSKA